MANTLHESLSDHLRDIEGVVESPSMFGPGNAFWCNGKEIAHFDSTDVIDLRLTAPIIRELRPVLRDNPRVELRKGRSDWIEIRVSSNDDVAFVAEMAERAAATHRPDPGTAAEPPPTGADLSAAADSTSTGRRGKVIG